MHSRLTRSFTVFLVLIFLLIPVSAALADYLGPDRTRTETREVCKVVLLECQYVPSKGDYRYHQVEDWLCSNEAKPWLAYPDAPSLLGCFYNPESGSGTVGERYWEKQYTAETTTVTYPEAQISGALQNCSAQNGWCVTAASLALSASEPVPGYAITLIEGARSGEPFACQGDSCQIPLLEGENAFTFWALSSWGDSSRMGTLTARVDTQPPLVNGAISGTPGEDGWYVSAVTVSASASDPQPGSGLQAFTYTLGGAWQPYAAPLTLSDGVHNVTFRAADRAGHTAEASASVKVDTLPPQVSASLGGEQVNSWYLGQVTFSASANDPSTGSGQAGSGLARIEYAPDGGAWQPYAAPVTFNGGQHTVQVRAVDAAGNVSAPASLAFQVDGAAPRIQLPAAWYIWQSGEVKVSDEQSSLAGVEIQIRDGQGRWQPVVRAYDADGASFTTSIAWDRKFADGTLAPVGEYDILISARDLAGNESRETARILIPAPGVTPAPLNLQPSNLQSPNLQSPNLPSALPSALSLPPAPTPTARAAIVQSFQSSNHQSNNLQSTNLQSNNLLFGAAALTAIAAATGIALAAKRRREEEERAQAERVRAEAEAKTAALRRQKEQAREQAKIQNYLQSKAALEAMLQNPALSEAEKARIREEAQTKGLASAFTLAHTAARGLDELDPTSAARQQAYQDYRAGERNAEAIAADYQARKAMQDYRQGERGEVVTPPPACTVEDAEKPKSWWQRAGEWVQDKVDKFVMHPPSWLSVSYSPREFSLGNYTAAHWVSYQPLARNLWEGISYQQIDVDLKTKPTLTTNPGGIVDINLGDGTITFNGKNSNIFIQPTALSFGWGANIYQRTDKATGIVYHTLNRSVVDIDLFGKNMLSLKISHTTGTEGSRIVNLNGTDVKETLETELDVTMNVHRWPRVIAATAAVYFVFEAGVTAIAPRILPWIVEKIPAVAPLLGVP